MAVNYYNDYSGLGLSKSLSDELRKKGVVIRGFDDNRTWDIKTMEQAYLQCPYIRMIENAKFNAVSNVNIRLFKEGKDEDTEIYNHKALDLLRQPNPFQDGGSLIAQRLCFQDLYGRTYVRAVDGRRAGFNETTKALWNLPTPQVKPILVDNGLIDVYSKFAIDEIITAYEFNSVDGYQNLSPDNILFYSDYMFSWIEDSSDMQTLLEAIRNLMAISESRGEIIKHRGALGLLSPKMSNDPAATFMGMGSAKTGLLSQVKRMFGTLRGQSNVQISETPVDWIPMATDIARLRLSESQMDEFNTCCDLLSVPRAIFDDKSTFENKKQSERKMYQDTIIPWCNGDASRMTKKLGLEGMYLKYDFSHLSIMQESEQEKATAKKADADRIKTLIDSGVITSDEARMELGYNTAKI